ncbi:RpiR family transcriptional regulator [Lachnotalea glycerini]|jgi:DNA-binding MurR/RpiR family transcriptional regulator|uniref:RpiR family transcriptional regulator n=1 Tax=Lachnotalea glycerini TaxID=1763509 RepID=A0A318EVC1_9FIRM|nr:MurR/RpiR family transcriptional regulator [Lachnotalea glycerini]PXV93462.1 RpiR family transcriptional regulator [Lachnotalea glycerini]
MTEFHFSSEVAYTKTERKIINYIYENPSSFVHISISELAKRLGTSESTISRFARHTGYADFKELRNAVLCHLEGNSSPAEKLNHTIYKQDLSSFDGMLHYQQFCIEKTLTLLDEEQLEAAMSAIIEANTIYIYAKGAAVSIAQLLKFRLSRFGFRIVLLPPGSSELFEFMNFITADDVVFLIGFQKTPREAEVLLKHQSIVPYKTILISSRLYNNAELLPTIQLYTYRGEPNEYHSMTAPIALVDALVLMIASRIGENATKDLKQLHSLKEKYKDDIPR